MGREHKDKDLQSDYSQYYDSFPFKTYDEIMAARKKSTAYRRGFLVLLILILAIIAAGITMGLFSGNLIVKRIMASMASPDDAASSSQTPETSKNDSGFTISVGQADKDSPALIVAYDVSQVIEKAKSSVVGIVAESYSNFSSSGSGSGIIMSEDGYIVTNNHVISGGDSITVVLQDGTNYPAYLIGADSQTDIAVLKIQATGLTPAEFGDSDALEIGEPAIAIGNPGGLDLQGTVTAGIVSATNRLLTVDNNVMSLIQTDASINPGNSGGPLLNQYGQVVGVTSAKITASGYEGLGFAIPVNTVKPIVEELVANGYVSGRPLVGVSVRTVSQLAAAFYNLPRGLLVDSIASDSAAANAGLTVGDIITSFNGTQINTVSEACTLRNQFKSGDTVSLSFYRGGRIYDIQFKLDEQKAADTVYDF